MKPRLPIITLTIAAIALVAHVSPEGVAETLEFNRAALAFGQWWRLLTAHVTHFDANHLAWDAAVFIGLGWICESESRVRTSLTLGIASVAIVIAVWIWQPQFETYRGLSGLDCALFGMFSTSLLRMRDRIPKMVGSVALLAVIAKSAFEIATGSTVFASGIGYAPVPLAHLFGVAAGLSVALIPSRWSSLSPKRWPETNHGSV